MYGSFLLFGLMFSVVFHSSQFLHYLKIKIYDFSIVFTKIMSASFYHI